MDLSDPRDSALRSLGYSITAPVLEPRPSRPPRPVGAMPDGGTPPDHHATVRRLKGIAIVATAVTVGAFGGLVVNHRVGSAAPAPAVTSGTVGAGNAGGAAQGSSQTVTPTDPFFDPNPGSGAGQGLAPVFGSGGGSPVFRSSGS